jgi:hypothetical protein
VALDLKRKLNGAPVRKPGRYNSNGHVEAALSVRERGRSVFAKAIQYKLPAVFTFTSEGTDDGQEDVFRDTERKAIDEIVAYLDVAVMKAMAARPANAQHYAFVLVKNLGSTQTVLFETAAEVMRQFGPALKASAPRVKRLLKEQRNPRAKGAVQGVLTAIGG